MKLSKVKLAFFAAMSVGCANSVSAQILHQVQPNSLIQQNVDAVYTQKFVIQLSPNASMGVTAVVKSLSDNAKTIFKIDGAQGRFIQITCPDVRSSADMESVLHSLRSSALLQNADPLFPFKKQGATSNTTQYLRTDPGWSMLNDSFQGGVSGGDFNNPRVSDFMQYLDGQTRSGQGYVAILDVGKPASPSADITAHFASEANFVESANFSDATDIDTPAGTVSHDGTIASLLAGDQNNTLGVPGIDPTQKLVQIRAFSETATADAFALENSIRWAAGLPVSGFSNNPTPAKVLNLSFASSGNQACYASLQSAIDDAINAGAIVVASAGNFGYTNFLPFPASCNGVISVGSVNSDGTLTSFSDSSPSLVTSTVGQNIATTDPTGGSSQVKYVSGTSYSAPIVAGVISAVKSLNPSLTPAQVLSSLQSTGKFVQPKQVTLSNNSTTTICNAQDCGRVFDAVAFVQQASAITVPTGTVKGTKAVSADVVNVTGLTLVPSNTNVQLSYDATNGLINVSSTVDGSFQIQFKADAAGNSAGSPTQQDYKMDLYINGGQINTFTSPSLVQASTNPVTVSSGGGGGGGSLSFVGLFCLAGLLALFKKAKV